MTFLGGSQTLMGVLASLIVLCVLIDKSNFIHAILEEISKRIKEEISNLDTATGFDEIENVSGESDYKLLIRHIRELQQKQDDGTISEAEKIALSKAARMEIKLNTKFSSLKSIPSNAFLKPAQDLLDNIVNSKVQVIAPCYALLSCLVIFLCDEIIVGFSSTTDIIITFLSLFFVYSLCFWILVWIIFLKNIKIEESNSLGHHVGSKKEPKSFGNRVLNFLLPCHIFVKMLQRVSWMKMLILIPLIYICCLFISYLMPQICLKRFIAFFIGLILPICIIAYKKANNKSLISFTYEFCFKHFGELCLISIILAIMTVIACHISDSIKSICFMYNNFTWIKILMQLLILFSGLICPFIMPYT